MGLQFKETFIWNILGLIGLVYRCARSGPRFYILDCRMNSVAICLRYTPLMVGGTWCPRCGSDKAVIDEMDWTCGKCKLKGTEKTFSGPWPDQTCKGCKAKFYQQQSFLFTTLKADVAKGMITCPTCKAQ